MSAPTDDDVVARHLLEARNELEQQKTALMRQLVKIESDTEVIDRMLADRGVNVRESDDPAGDPSGTSTTPAKSTMTTRDGIITVLRSEDRDFQLTELVQGVLELGVEAQEGSIRSVVSRVVREGLAVKGSSGRASYRAARPEDAEGDSVSAESPSDVEPDQAAEGGDFSSEAELDGDRDDFDGRNDHHHAGAPIGA